ncbi:unnamed protein product [Gadus morhua 'NCC']
MINNNKTKEQPLVPSDGVPTAELQVRASHDIIAPFHFRSAVWEEGEPAGWCGHGGELELFYTPSLEAGGTQPERCRRAGVFIAAEALSCQGGMLEHQESRAQQTDPEDRGGGRTPDRHRGSDL